MQLLRAGEMVVGVLIVLVFLMDIFQSVVLPRPSPRRIRPSAFLTRWTWVLWRDLAERRKSVQGREEMLGSYAPFLVLLTLAMIVVGLMFGYALMLFAIGDQTRPPLQSFSNALYFSAISFLTLGFGDYVPVDGPARVLIVVEAGTGLGTVALVISLLFSLYGNFQHREVLLITLDALAAAPPSAVNLLERYSKLKMTDRLGDTFDDWTTWAAEVLESHLAYPILSYFRSSHDNESWVSGLGCVLDAATLVLTTVEDGPVGPARVMYEVGSHLVEDLSRNYGFDQEHQVGIELQEFEQARERLAAAGWALKEADQAWTLFSKLRGDYAYSLNEMARYWAIPPAQWVGDRSILPSRAHAARA